MQENKVIDKEDEYKYHSPELSGLKEFAEIAKNNLIKASGIPKELLFKESNGSLGSLNELIVHRWSGLIALYKSL